MIEREDLELSLSRQCRLLEVSRSSLYYRLKGESEETLGLMRRLDELFLKYPLSTRSTALVRWSGTFAAKAFVSVVTGCGV